MVTKNSVRILSNSFSPKQIAGFLEVHKFLMDYSTIHEVLSPVFDECRLCDQELIYYAKVHADVLQ
jgi:hypothetical protein